MKGNKKLEQNKHIETLPLLPRSLLTGFIGGIFWSTIAILMYYFNFSEVSPRLFILRSWLKDEWTDGWLGDLVSIILVGLISIIVALIYYSTLKKVNSMWAGVLFGIVLWCLIFLLFQPIFNNIPSFSELQLNTIVSTLCLYILYGAFIGYSISYDYHDTQVRETT
ncbi:hypothetical protein D8M04_02170 [Oceanobacillus piezotolerans]|uniref:Uncharacterized protein n=1 Tax=Oceanobacillus piezotolerans TaxID=2448030 RepID=A0A498D9U7_9BACI|nr:YqhR family membrane protein [Oceanobacillus piezotolerans]RLL48103.1 hypothetical protein D8M04_02170 [Oceanobacillus piezotolerans]